MKAYSFIDNDGITIQFLPTENKKVESNYMNGKIGDALWQQVIGLVVVECYYTEKEIFSLMNNGFEWTTTNIPDMPKWGIGEGYCSKCGSKPGEHKNFCPDNIINADSYQYRVNQM